MTQLGAETPVATRAVAPSEPGTLVQRLRAALVAFLSWLACRLPERPLVALADLAGEAWYRLAPRRADRARANLRRVALALAAAGTPTNALGEAAARDRRSLEVLVRAAFRHAARYYLEVARTPRVTHDDLRRRLVIETPDVVDEAFGGDRPVIFVGLHFGSIELPALYLTDRTGRPATAPMETIDDPPLQRYFVRTRGSVGVRIVSLREARTELAAALRRGESVGLVGDRDITGGGKAVPLFGAPAMLPIGPALLAMESGAPLYVVSVRRTAIGRYIGRLRHVPIPTEGTRRERLTAALDALARAFEDAVATAPEQWWAVFFPIWPDLEPAGTHAA